MSETEGISGDPTVAGIKRPKLMPRVLRERWRIPGSVRQPLVERLSKIIRDPGTPHREVLSAATAILAASKINLANIAMTMKVQEIEELEKRMDEMERKLDEREAEQGKEPTQN
jgi:hypothetical protein